MSTIEKKEKNGIAKALKAKLKYVMIKIEHIFDLEAGE